MNALELKALIDAGTQVIVEINDLGDQEMMCDVGMRALVTGAVHHEAEGVALTLSFKGFEERNDPLMLPNCLDKKTGLQNITAKAAGFWRDEDVFWLPEKGDIDAILRVHDGRSDLFDQYLASSTKDRYVNWLENQLTTARSAASNHDPQETTWSWLRHPSRHGGQPFPARFFRKGGQLYYQPFDEDGLAFLWAKRDAEWAIIPELPDVAAMISAEGLDAVICPGCASHLTTETVGCPDCGYQDHEEGRLLSLGGLLSKRSFPAEGAKTLNGVSPAFLLKAMTHAAHATLSGMQPSPKDWPTKGA